MTTRKNTSLYPKRAGKKRGPTPHFQLRDSLAQNIYTLALSPMLTKVIDWDGGSNNLAQAKLNFKKTADYCRLAAEAFFEDP